MASANPSASSSSAGSTGVRPPSIMLASVGVPRRASLIALSSSTFSGDSMKITSAPASVGRGLDLLNHLLHRDHLAAEHVPAPLGEDLVLELDGADTGPLVLAYRAADVERVAVAGHVDGVEPGNLNHLGAEHVVRPGSHQQLLVCKQLL